MPLCSAVSTSMSNVPCTRSPGLSLFSPISCLWDYATKAASGASNIIEQKKPPDFSSGGREVQLPLQDRLEPEGKAKANNAVAQCVAHHVIADAGITESGERSLEVGRDAGIFKE